MSKEIWALKYAEGVKILTMKKIGITMGDPAGVGPELIVKLSEHFDIEKNAYIIYGEEKTIKEAERLVGRKIDFKRVSEVSQASSPGVYLVDLNLLKSPRVEPSVASGRAAVAYLARATADAVRGNIQGVLTMPINKFWASKAGFSFPGQTEYLAHASGVKDFAMAFYSEDIKLVLLTIHLPLREVFKHITKENIKKKAYLVDREFNRLFGFRPRIKILGLNPHAGEGGELGREETEIIEPAVRELLEEGLKVEGPLVPDTAFLRREKEDVFLAMYHDQGLIAFKLLAFDRGVNLTLGLPFVRTSPDHGTAYDIAWKGLADVGASLSALRLLEKVLDGSHTNKV